MPDLTTKRVVTNKVTNTDKPKKGRKKKRISRK